MQIDLTETKPIKEYDKLIGSEMEKQITHFQRELNQIRTGRAHPALLEGLKVNAYDTRMPLNQLAMVTAPESTMLLIQPFDPSQLEAIEKAILASDLGLTPANDGAVIRVVIPKMSESRRQSLVKLLHTKTQVCKNGIRQVRQHVQHALRSALKEKRISEDYEKQIMALLQKTTDRFTHAADDLAEAKEKEIMTT